MKPVVLFLSGIAATLAGASTRSCQDGIPHELINAWCGPAPHNALTAFSHTHCAGCAVMYVGLATMLAAVVLAIPRLRAIHGRV